MERLRFYQEPLNPELTLDTGTLEIAESFRRIADYLKGHPVARGEAAGMPLSAPETA